MTVVVEVFMFSVSLSHDREPFPDISSNMTLSLLKLTRRMNCLDFGGQRLKVAATSHNTFDHNSRCRVLE